MAKNIFTLIIITIIYASSTMCNRLEKIEDNSENTKIAWQKQLDQNILLLGHRNWIVITDMAYPLQAKQGITTLYANEPYFEVLSHVNNVINSSSHIFANIYMDKEFIYLNEDLLPGIESFHENHQNTLLASNIIYRKHEDLINTLDSVSNKFQVIIIKTKLTIPYTSTFFELDCKYWNATKQKLLEASIGE